MLPSLLKCKILKLRKAALLSLRWLLLFASTIVPAKARIARAGNSWPSLSTLSWFFFLYEADLPPDGPALLSRSRDDPMYLLSNSIQDLSTSLHLIFAARLALYRLAAAETRALALSEGFSCR